MARDYFSFMQFKRDKIQLLNGKWDFYFDSLDSEKLKINVPFVYQSKLSGINTDSIHDVIYYRREVDIPEGFNENIILHFDAIDHEAYVYIDDQLVISHTGGYTPFSVNISPYLSDDKFTILVKVIDPSFDKSIARGKQTWDDKPHDIWYTRSSGIWQNVWLENVHDIHIENIKYHPDIKRKSVNIEVNVSDNAIGKTLVMKIKGRYHKYHIDNCKMNIEYLVEKLWSVDEPNLYDVVFSIEDDYVYDSVSSYFGLRSVKVFEDKILMNNEFIYQKLLLNQGYYQDGLLSASSDEDFINDIKMMKAMGFNGCRIHQKVEDPRFLYWCDKLGFLVWGECPAFYEFSNKANDDLKKMWDEIIERDYNHPSIITWTLYNESWGIEGVNDNKMIQDAVIGLYEHVKKLDSTRLVIANDGWEVVKGDFIGFHNYCHGRKDEIEKYQQYCHDLADIDALLEHQPGNHPILASCFPYSLKPIILSEFGGIAYQHNDGWGYTSVNNEVDFLADYQRTIEAIKASKLLCGYCYTQFTDVEIEQNGLLTYDHKPKVALEKIRKINDMIDA